VGFGKDDLVCEQLGAVWHFSSEANLKLFKENPDKYMPQFGCYGAQGKSCGYKAETQPNA
jgi:hypothetical protein